MWRPSKAGRVYFGTSKLRTATCSLRIQAIVSNGSFALPPAADRVRPVSDRRSLVSGIGRGRGWRWPLRSPHRQFLGHPAWQLLGARRFAGLPHRRRHFRPRTARRAFPWRLRGPTRLDWRILLWIDRHLALFLALFRILLPLRQRRCCGNVPWGFKHRGLRSEPPLHSGAWHTASMLWPSGSSTNAP